MANIIEQLEAEQCDRDIPEFHPGDTVIVQVKVVEGQRERLQAFEGTVIARKNRGLNSSFTVRKISYGEGVERVFQTYSPSIAGITVKRRGDVRRGQAVLHARPARQGSQDQGEDQTVFLKCFIYPQMTQISADYFLFFSRVGKVLY